MAYGETPAAVATLIANANLANGLVVLNGSGQVPSGLLPSTTQMGVTNGSNASAGVIGEIIESDVPVGSAISAPQSAEFNITSVTLTPGDWDCRGNAAYLPVVTTFLAGTVGAQLSTTSGAFLGNETGGTNVSMGAEFAGELMATPTGTWRFNVTTNTTLYLVGVAAWVDTSGGAGSVTAYGSIQCRRMR